MILAAWHGDTMEEASVVVTTALARAKSSSWRRLMTGLKAMAAPARVDKVR